VLEPELEPAPSLGSVAAADRDETVDGDGIVATAAVGTMGPPVMAVSEGRGLSVAKAYELESDTCIGGLGSWRDGSTSDRRARLEGWNRATAEGDVVVWGLDVAWGRLLVGDIALVGPEEAR
jgi:hypothetical protein